MIEAVLVADGDRTTLVIEERGDAAWMSSLRTEPAGRRTSRTWQLMARDEPADWRTRWVELTPSYRELTVRPA